MSFNIVFIGNVLYPEGMAGTRRMQYFIDALAPEHQVFVLLLRQAHPGSDASSLRGHHRGVEYRTIGQDIDAGWRLPFQAIRYCFQGIAELLRRRSVNGPNIVFLYGGPNLENLHLIIAARLMGYRVIMDIVEDEYFVGASASTLSKVKALSNAFLSRHVSCCADAVTVISGFLKRKYENVSKGKIPVVRIPVSVDLEEVTPSGTGFHSPVRIFYAGSFGQKDGVSNLLKAFDQVYAEYPDIELQMTGKGMPSDMNDVQETIQSLKSRMNVSLLGFLSSEEYFRRLRGCDIPCVVRIASDFADRGFPFKLGEYLATGRPVIASRIGDIPSFLTDRKTAMLVDPGSVDDVADALRYLLSDQQRALKIGAAGRAIAENDFDARRNGEKLITLMQELVQRH